MPSLSDQVKDILKANGCYFHRQGKGDHEIWYSPHSGRKFAVDHGMKSRHTANDIMKQAGLTHRFR
jgi:predicted RNA binding protein YcfA (HicA-like mRNA interferase family)